MILNRVSTVNLSMLINLQTVVGSMGMVAVGIAALVVVVGQQLKTPI